MVKHCISCRADLFSESQRIKYTIESKTKDIPDARTYLLTLKEIRIKYVSFFLNCCLPVLYWLLLMLQFRLHVYACVSLMLVFIVNNFFQHIMFMKVENVPFHGFIFYFGLIALLCSKTGSYILQHKIFHLPFVYV